MTPPALPELGSARIAVLGLGYVGLPLAIAFAEHFEVVGFDLNAKRVQALQAGLDANGEAGASELAAAKRLKLTADADELSDCSVFVVAVPTPVDSAKSPDLGPIVDASNTIGKRLGRGSVVIYESTVYPGATEEICVPVLENVSRLTLNQDFWVGYSPERINPGDPTRKLAEIVKVTSASAPAAARFVDALYRKIITAGTCPVSTIRAAEASKVIENIQRDVNIALMNELAVLFHRLGLDTQEVLEAAGSKWNFLPFRPGLVGGHCIGVDPYYLIHQAAKVGYYPQMISAGRRINDDMGRHVASRVVKLMLRKGLAVAAARILILGLSFKENCPDLRNTRVLDIVAELQRFGALVDVYDPVVQTSHVPPAVRTLLVETPKRRSYAAAIVAVSHDVIVGAGANWVRGLLQADGVIFDVKYAFPAEQTDARL